LATAALDPAAFPGASLLVLVGASGIRSEVHLVGFGHSAEEAACLKSKPQWRSNPSPSWLAV
jgi:hypothetical protein